MSPVPSGGFVDGLPEAAPVNRDLPVPYEATWRVGGDGSDFEVVQEMEHVEVVAGGGEADVQRGPDQTGTTQTIATLRRTQAYGAALLDSFTSAPGLPELSEVEGLFFGESGGDVLWQFGEKWDDAGTAITARMRTLPMAPGGIGGEAIFQNLYLALEWRSAATVTVTPILDGDRLTALSRTLELDGPLEPTRDDFEIPLNRPHDVGGTEELRYGLRGTWLQVELEVEVQTPTETGLIVEGVEVEQEVVRESHPGVSYTIEDLEQVTLESPVPWYMGAAGTLYRGNVGQQDAGETVTSRVQTRETAPAGPGGEAIAHNLYVALTRLNPSSLDLVVTPLVDGEELEADTFTLEGVASPVTEVLEVPLSVAHTDDEGEELLRTAPRGTWFAARLETDGPDGLLVLEGVALEQEIVRESEEAVDA